MIVGTIAPVEAAAAGDSVRFRPLEDIGSVSAVSRGVTFDVHAGHETGRVEIAAEHEVVVARMSDGVRLAAASRPLIGRTIVVAAVHDATVD